MPKSIVIRRKLLEADYLGEEDIWFNGRIVEGTISRSKSIRRDSEKKEIHAKTDKRPGA